MRTTHGLEFLIWPAFVAFISTGPSGSALHSGGSGFQGDILLVVYVTSWFRNLGDAGCNLSLAAFGYRICGSTLADGHAAVSITAGSRGEFAGFARRNRIWRLSSSLPLRVSLSVGLFLFSLRVSLVVPPWRWRRAQIGCALLWRLQVGGGDR